MPALESVAGAMCFLAAWQQARYAAGERAVGYSGRLEMAFAYLWVTVGVALVLVPA